MPGFNPVDTKQSFPELEERVLARWREGDVFERSLANRAEAEVWSFYEGPPTANGRPGSHHVLARVFKDVYPRYKTMCGYRVPRKAGWDCHGLPVELEVEKQLGISSKQEIEEFGIAEFNARCRESVFEYVEEWNRLTERIGFWIDLDDPYVTLEDDYIESVWWSLKQASGTTGRLYEGHKVVPYCPRDGTPLSSHEVAQGYKDVEDPSIYVRFPLLAEDGSEAGESLLVWTTTPWTLPGNVAVAVAPEVTYVRALVAGETLILAEPLLEKVLGEGVPVTDRFPGSDLVGRRYAGPVFELADGGPAAGGAAFRVLAGDFVTTEDGTGLVHIAPAFGEDDYRVAAANGIFDPTQRQTLYNPVKPDGHFDERVAGFADRFVKDPEVTRELIADLERRGLLFREQVYEHSYPHCWRCGTPLLYYATSSWYIATSEVKEQMLANNEAIGWHPEHVKHGRFGKWLENNVDWALSRDRYWGTPLPVWRCGDGDCGELDCIGSVAELRERSGGEVPDDLHRPYIDEVTIRLRQVRRRDAPGRVGDRHLVRQRRDAVRPVPLPVRERGGVRGALPGRLHLRGPGPDPRLVLHAAGRVDAALRRVELPQLRLPRPHPRPRGPEDVEEPRQRGRPLGGDLRPRRRRLPLVLPDRPAALGRLPLLGRHGRRIGAPVPAHALEHLLVLGPLRERRGPRPGSTSRGAPEPRQRPRPLGALAAAGDDRDGARAAWTTSTAPPPAGRSPSTSRSSPTGTCGSRAAASGTATAPPSRPCATACWRRRRCWPRSRPFLADEIHLNLAGGAGGDRRAARLGPPARLPRAPTRRWPTRSWRRGWRRCASRSNSAAPPAPRPRRRCASRCAAP